MQQTGDLSNTNTRDHDSFQLTNANPGLNCNNLQIGQALCLALEGKDCEQVHIVTTPGETCSTIAQDAGIDTTVLLKNNQNIHTNCDNLGIGDVICVAPDVIPY